MPINNFEPCFQLWNYENESAWSIAEKAIQLLEEAIEPELNKVASKTCELAQSIVECFSSVSTIQNALQVMNEEDYKVIRVPAVSAGCPMEDDDNTLSMAGSIESMVVGDLISELDNQLQKSDDFCCVPVGASKLIE